ncbi:GNAT family N-acetyltransferase [Phaeobacter porticola]|uniref:Putative acetyltransferase n=1 Tax=Phaeobacter porticola TaxID=1844006 RepID=A0A1L3I081_9RHOB|nr:GNAT family N-acetyltransferase [Phaeobacter porticola]APG45526.1 putative acetyltransferase [Phaeobacter porticola]
MSISLTLILPRERARLAAALANYYSEIAPALAIDPSERAGRMLHRKDVTAFWIRQDDVRIGFAIVLNLPDDRRELSEFYIDQASRRQGYGHAAASLIFAEFPGFWRMGISGQSPSAVAFWGTCLSALRGVEQLRDGAPFTEHQIKSYSFHIAGDHND